MKEQIIKFIMLDEPKNEADKESVRDIKERLPEHLEPTIMELIKKCLPAMEANVAELPPKRVRFPAKGAIFQRNGSSFRRKLPNSPEKRQVPFLKTGQVSKTSC